MHDHAKSSASSGAESPFLESHELQRLAVPPLGQPGGGRTEAMAREILRLRQVVERAQHKQERAQAILNKIAELTSEDGGRDLVERVRHLVTNQKLLGQVRMGDLVRLSGDNRVAKLVPADGIGPFKEPFRASTSQVMQDDVAAILRALGLGDHARSKSCHEIVRSEILPFIEKMRAAQMGSKTVGDVFNQTDVTKSHEVLDKAGVPRAGCYDLVERVRYLVGTIDEIHGFLDAAGSIRDGMTLFGRVKALCDRQREYDEALSVVDGAMSVLPTRLDRIKRLVKMACDDRRHSQDALAANKSVDEKLVIVQQQAQREEEANIALDKAGAPHQDERGSLTAAQRVEWLARDRDRRGMLADSERVWIDRVRAAEIKEMNLRHGIDDAHKLLDSVGIARSEPHPAHGTVTLGLAARICELAARCQRNHGGPVKVDPSLFGESHPETLIPLPLMRPKYNRESVARRIESIASGLSYNDSTQEGTAKHWIYELASRVRSGSVTCPVDAATKPLHQRIEELTREGKAANELRQAIGLMSTAKPDMVMHPADPIWMAREVVEMVQGAHALLSAYGIVTGKSLAERISILADRSWCRDNERDRLLQNLVACGQLAESRTLEDPSTWPGLQGDVRPATKAVHKLLADYLEREDVVAELVKRNRALNMRAFAAMGSRREHEGRGDLVEVAIEKLAGR